MYKPRAKKQNTITLLQSVRADSLTGFIAGFLVGVIGMYVYVVIITISG